MVMSPNTALHYGTHPTPLQHTAAHALSDLAERTVRPNRLESGRRGGKAVAAGGGLCL